MAKEDAMKEYISKLGGGSTEGGSSSSSQEQQQQVWPTFSPKVDSMLPKDSFKGKVALVTGGGTGLGKGMATTLSALGAQVVITSRKEDVLKKASEEIAAITGNKVHYTTADVRDPEAVKKAIDFIENNFGLPNIVINNA